MKRQLINRVVKIEKATAEQREAKATSTQRAVEFLDRVITHAHALIVAKYTDPAAPVIDNYEFRVQRSEFNRGLQMIELLQKAAERKQDQQWIKRLITMAGLLQQALSIEATTSEIVFNT